MDKSLSSEFSNSKTYKPKSIDNKKTQSESDDSESSTSSSSSDSKESKDSHDNNGGYDGDKPTEQDLLFTEILLSCNTFSMNTTGIDHKDPTDPQPYDPSEKGIVYGAQLGPGKSSHSMVSIF